MMANRAKLYVSGLLCFASASAGACSQERVYVGDGKLYQVALTPTTTPAFEGEDGALFIVETHAALPVRVPSNAEMAALRTGVTRYPGLPFARLPWVERDDFGVQLDITLSNLDRASHDIDVIVNGLNEFFEYIPGIVEDQEGAIPLHSQWERRYRLGPNERIALTVREEEMDEMAVDLATVVNGAPNSDEVVYFENKSSSDPRTMKYIPKVIPGLTGLRLGLRATSPVPILLEATVRVRDVGDKLAQDGEPTLQTMPVAFESVVPEA